MLVRFEFDRVFIYNSDPLWIHVCGKENMRRKWEREIIVVIAQTDLTTF